MIDKRLVKKIDFIEIYQVIGGTAGFNAGEASRLRTYSNVDQYTLLKSL